MEWKGNRAFEIEIEHTPATRYPPPATCYPRPATRHPPPATLHPPPATRHPPPSTRHPPPVTRHPWKRPAAGLPFNGLASHPGGSRNTPSPFMVLKPELELSSLMIHLACMHT